MRRAMGVRIQALRIRSMIPNAQACDVTVISGSNTSRATAAPRRCYGTSNQFFTRSQWMRRQTRDARGAAIMRNAIRTIGLALVSARFAAGASGQDNLRNERLYSIKGNCSA